MAILPEEYRRRKQRGVKEEISIRGEENTPGFKHRQTRGQSAGDRIKEWPASSGGPCWAYYLATVASLVLPHFGHLAFTRVVDQAYTSLLHFEQMHASPFASGFGGRSSFPHSGHRSSGIIFTSIRLYHGHPVNFIPAAVHFRFSYCNYCKVSKQCKCAAITFFSQAHLLCFLLC
jgi:hypothetical protein